MTELEKYCTDILDGKIVACHRMKQVSEMLLTNLHHPKEFHFDINIANRHIEFIEKFCKLPSGKLGMPFKLELFQKARLQAVFGFVDDNDLRQYNEVLIIEGRKNGKTSESAAVEIDLLVNDNEGSPQIYNIATKLDQAKLGFNACHKMIKQSPILSAHVKKRASDLSFSYNFGFIKAMASNSNSLDGLDAHGVIIDELAAIKDRDLYDLMKQSMGARLQPLLFTITTNGFVRESIFDAQYEYACALLDGKLSEPNKRFLPFIYELDDRSEWDMEECWMKANPGLGTVKSIEYLRQMVQKAKDDPSFKPTVMVKDFNMKENAASTWLNWETIENKELIPDTKFRYGIGGFDGAETTDLTAAKLLCMRHNDEKVYVKQMYWLPEETLLEREKTDKIPYSLWERQGLLRTVPGNRVTFDHVLEWFIELQEQEDIYIFAIGYDPWHVDQSMLQRFKDTFGKQAMIPVRQGVATLSAPMRALKADLAANKVVYNDHPIDKWCLSNIEVKADINGNIQPVKGLDVRKRIDGTMALIDAYVVLQDKKEEYLALI